jgi:hypothetical protein
MIKKIIVYLGVLPLILYTFYLFIKPIVEAITMFISEMTYSLSFL